ncbi:MAG: hypothetical protein ACLPUG_18610 [Acidimicrobiales bacterium]|jgi:sugar lactone lactonase YvrE
MNDRDLQHELRTMIDGAATPVSAAEARLRARGPVSPRTSLRQQGLWAHRAIVVAVAAPILVVFFAPLPHIGLFKRLVNTAKTSPAAGGPAPGTVFVANAGRTGGGTGNGSVTAYRLSATGNARPNVVITAGINGPSGLAFDAAGNLWVRDVDGVVVEYNKAELDKASPVPTILILSPSLNDTEGGLAFDSSGDLWVTNATSDAVEFTSAQLAKSGSPTGRVIIHDPSMCGVVFDRSGNLWSGGTDTVFEFAKAHLAKSGYPTPQVTIASESLGGPCRPAFDSSGDMWVANYHGATVVEFTKADLARSGSPAPQVMIFPNSLSNPGSVALDSSGDLWVPNAGTNAIFEFAKAQLAKSGFRAPAENIAGPATGLNWPWALAIEPQ